MKETKHRQVRFMEETDYKMEEDDGVNNLKEIKLHEEVSHL